MSSTAEYKAQGDIFYKAKDYKAAISVYTSGLALDPVNVSLLNNRSAAYLMTGQFNESLSDCESVIAVDSSSSKAYFRKATAMKGLGNLDGAIDSLNSGLLVDSSSSTAISDRASLLRAKDSIVEMKSLVDRREFKRAMTIIESTSKEIGSNFRDINILKVECLLNLHPTSPEDAYNLTNQMMRTAHPGDLDLLRLRAQCLYIRGDMENSIKHCQSALRLDPDNRSVRDFYRKVKLIEENKESGSSAFKLGSYQQAIDFWTIAIDADVSNKALVTKLYCNRATALFKLRKYRDSIADCNRALAADSGNMKAYLRRGECNFAIGEAENIQKAISDFEHCLEMQSDEESSKVVQAKIKQAKVALKNVNRKDLYKLLGCTRDATEEEIKKAYKKSALLYHPDRQSGKSEEEVSVATAKFKEIGQAYEILTDPAKKQRYDEGSDIEDIEQGGGHGGHGHGHGGIDPNILFQMFMQQQMHGRGGF